MKTTNIFADIAAEINKKPHGDIKVLVVSLEHAHGIYTELDAVSLTVEYNGVRESVEGKWLDVCEMCREVGWEIDDAEGTEYVNHLEEQLESEATEATDKKSTSKKSPALLYDFVLDGVRYIKYDKSEMCYIEENGKRKRTSRNVVNCAAIDYYATYGVDPDLTGHNHDAKDWYEAREKFRREHPCKF